MKQYLYIFFYSILSEYFWVCYYNYKLNLQLFYFFNFWGYTMFFLLRIHYCYDRFLIRINLLYYNLSMNIFENFLDMSHKYYNIYIITKCILRFHFMIFFTLKASYFISFLNTIRN